MCEERKRMSAAGVGIEGDPSKRFNLENLRKFAEQKFSFGADAMRGVNPEYASVMKPRKLRTTQRHHLQTTTVRRAALSKFFFHSRR